MHEQTEVGILSLRNPGDRLPSAGEHALQRLRLTGSGLHPVPVILDALHHHAVAAAARWRAQQHLPRLVPLGAGHLRGPPVRQPLREGSAY